MQHIFIDFEMNMIPRAARPQDGSVRSEIVEIGAARLGGRYEPADTFSCFVRPALNTVTRECTRITGIRDGDVAAAPALKEALELFTAWIGPVRSRCYSWSICDRVQLTGECAFKQIPLGPCFRRWMDFQRVYTRIMGLSSSLSLKNAIGSVDYTFIGSQHRAVDDAVNSARLLTLVKSGAEFEKKARSVKRLLEPPPRHSGSTIADLLGDQLGRFLPGGP